MGAEVQRLTPAPNAEFKDQVPCVWQARLDADLHPVNRPPSAGHRQSERISDCHARAESGSAGLSASLPKDASRHRKAIGENQIGDPGRTQQELALRAAARHQVRRPGMISRGAVISEGVVGRTSKSLREINQGAGFRSTCSADSRAGILLYCDVFK
jgi:hypothetical protein